MKILFSLLLVGFVVAELPSALHDLVQQSVVAVLRLSGAGGG